MQVYQLGMKEILSFNTPNVYYFKHEMQPLFMKGTYIFNQGVVF